jgi:urate oxidase
MAVVLAHHSYGKSRVRLTKVTRLAGRHEVRELLVAITLEGDFALSHTVGDNRLVIPTDTMKNVVYALAKQHRLESIEDFAMALADHFLEHHGHVAASIIRITEQPLLRIRIGDLEHPHAFAGAAREVETCGVKRSRGGPIVESGLDELFLLKTTGSAFTGFLRDRYTTLADASDRLLATMLTAEWRYADATVSWNSARETIRRALVQTFAEHESLSVQHTLHAMGSAALAACPAIDRITLSMPNKHRILVDLGPFGLENAGEVFVATDEPHGTITGTLARG